MKKIVIFCIGLLFFKSSFAQITTRTPFWIVDEFNKEFEFKFDQSQALSSNIIDYRNSIDELKQRSDTNSLSYKNAYMQQYRRMDSIAYQLIFPHLQDKFKPFKAKTEKTIREERSNNARFIKNETAAKEIKKSDPNLVDRKKEEANKKLKAKPEFVDIYRD